MTNQITERAFELAIVDSLIKNSGYQLGDAANFNRELAFDKTTIFQFIQTSQLEAWQKLIDIHGAEVEPKFIQRLCQELENRGMLDVLRYGIIDHGVRFKLAFFKPAIAWLAYQLASLYNDQDERVFDLVIVITDRKVLDQQLQNTIYQFEHKQGVVQKIDKNSAQLAEALVSGTNIIITTLQKFPFVLDKIREILEKNKIGELPKRNYALIVDEAHSSESGEASKKMKEVLSINDLSLSAKQESMVDDEDDIEDNIRKSMRSRGKQPNLSFFAFTATPKPKTLEDFGHMNSQGQTEPFHLYSMRQAIEEGFIMDVLQNYTTYRTFFKINKAIADDPNISKKKTSRAIAKFLSLHPHNLAQKTQVIIEHFRQCVMHKIGGKAKAMVVTVSG